MQKNNTAEDYAFLDKSQKPHTALTEILSDLKKAPKKIHPKYFYDTRGSELFEEITRLPEYYPTKSEVSIFKRNAEDIANHCGTGAVIVEPGSGSSEKVRLLFDSLKPLRYVAIDIAGDFLERAAEKLASEFPDIDVVAISADFYELDVLPQQTGAESRLIFYPGSTIGNMQPGEARAFLGRLRGWLNHGDRGVLIGIDLHKDKHTLEAAYNDKQGVTAQFNKNILANVNSLTASNFDSEAFEHRAVYNIENQRIEMYLDTKNRQQVEVNGEQIVLESGESILTEYSYKYTLKGIDELAQDSGFKREKSWFDGDKLFSVSLLVPA